jgi:hypothetical protein
VEPRQRRRHGWRWAAVEEPHAAGTLERVAARCCRVVVGGRIGVESGALRLARGGRPRAWKNFCLLPEWSRSSIKCWSVSMAHRDRRRNSNGVCISMFNWTGYS